MSIYEFSNPVVLGVVSPGLGPSVQSQGEWPRKGLPMRYRYTGLGDRRLGKQYRYAGLGTVPPATQPLQISPDMLTHLTGPAASAMTTLGAVQGVVSALAGIAGIVIGNISSIDANTRSVANTVLGWITAIVNGHPLTAVTFSPGEVNSMADYCTHARPMIEVGVNTAIDIARPLLLAAHNSGATSALETLRTILIGGPGGGGGIANFICTLPQVQQVIAQSNTQTCWDGSNIPATSTCPPVPPPPAPCPGGVLCWNRRCASSAAGCQPRFVFCPSGGWTTVTPGGVWGDTPSCPAGAVTTYRCWDGTVTPTVSQCPPHVVCPDGTWAANASACPAPGGGGGGGGSGDGAPSSGVSTPMLVGGALLLGLGLYAYSKR